jgi:hypothetical protein
MLQVILLLLHFLVDMVFAGPSQEFNTLRRYHSLDQCIFPMSLLIWLHAEEHDL